jgi:Flp pilus assembly protein TadD
LETVRSPFVKADCKARAFSGLALGLVIVSFGGALAGLWWAGTWRADINFLPAMAPAEWIVYPVAPNVNSHRRLEFPTAFETTFDLGGVPGKALLQIAGFHRYALLINGTSPPGPVRTGTNWKRPDVFDVAGQLRRGTNRIEVTVFNSDGPPALWLSLDAGGFHVNSGGRWRASYAGAVWCAAVPAAAPRSMTTVGPAYGLPVPWASVIGRWPTLLVFAFLSASACWILCRWRPFLHPDPAVALSPTAVKGRGRLREMVPLAVLAALWVALFANNLGALPRLTGFDSPDHVEYVRYIQEHASLPLASKGWEMFQAPLYYMVSAAWLWLLHLSISDPGGITALRILGLAVGVAHFVTIWATLRLVFPSERSKAGWGVVLAAFLPPLIYLSQSVTNEAFAAMMVSVCLLLTMRGLKQERLTWRLCAGLGLCLGAALLAKTTAFLVLPLVFGALIWRWLEKRTLTPAQWIARAGLILALCALVGGWHYARLWIHYGSPLVGVWDPKLGTPWWQDDGYRTSAFYLRFGNALLHPWFGASQSFGDGIYATLWGDGLLGGAADFLARPPWNFDLMAIGYWLALLPASAVLAGGILALYKFIRQPSAEWFLILGFGCMVLWAMVYMSMAVPYYCMVKAFYGLSALVPFCAFGALGADSLARQSAKLRSLVCVGFGRWAVNSYACFWISRTSVLSDIKHASTLMGEDRFIEATGFLTQSLSRKPQNADLEFALAHFYTITGRVDDGIREAKTLLQEHPEDCRGHHVLALAFAGRHQTGRAIEELRRMMEEAPGYDPSWDSFVPLLIAFGQPDEIAGFCRQALAMAPFSPDLRLAFGMALLLQGQETEAGTQLRYAYLLNPGSIDTLAARAWKLATDPDAAARNGTAAVTLAEHACALTGYGKTVYMDILATAYAETGRHADAIRIAERAEALALASGDLHGVAATRELLQRLRTGHPFREE